MASMVQELVKGGSVPVDQKHWLYGRWSLNASGIVAEQSTAATCLPHPSRHHVLNTSAVITKQQVAAACPHPSPPTLSPSILTPQPSPRTFPLCCDHRATSCGRLPPYFPPYPVPIPPHPNYPHPPPVQLHHFRATSCGRPFDWTSVMVRASVMQMKTQRCCRCGGVGVGRCGGCAEVWRLWGRRGGCGAGGEVWGVSSAGGRGGKGEGQLCGYPNQQRAVQQRRRLQLGDCGYEQRITGRQ